MKDKKISVQPKTESRASCTAMVCKRYNEYMLCDDAVYRIYSDDGQRKWVVAGPGDNGIEVWSSGSSVSPPTREQWRVSHNPDGTFYLKNVYNGNDVSAHWTQISCEACAPVPLTLKVTSGNGVSLAMKRLGKNKPSVFFITHEPKADRKQYYDTYVKTYISFNGDPRAYSDAMEKLHRDSSHTTSRAFENHPNNRSQLSFWKDFPLTPPSWRFDKI